MNRDASSSLAACENKQAWEHKVYEWRVNSQGTPKEMAKKIVENPKRFLRFHAGMFERVSGKKVASICGSDGKRAVALAALGAYPVVFDISEPQKKYALELAEAAGVKIGYETGDFCGIDDSKYKETFDYAYAEGGILHYFHNLPLFFRKSCSLLKNGGTFIMSDYHPFQKTCIADKPERNVELTGGNYFDTRIHTGHVPYLKYFPEEERAEFPACQLRFYTLSEIFNGMITEGFIIRAFYEYPKEGGDMKMPFEFTIVAEKWRDSYKNP